LVYLKEALENNNTILKLDLEMNNLEKYEKQEILKLINNS